jgi:hypothetical protein
LLYHERLKTQLVSLERRTGRSGGRDHVDHPPGSHDDIATAVAGAILTASSHRERSPDEEKLVLGLYRSGRRVKPGEEASIEEGQLPAEDDVAVSPSGGKQIF